MNLINLEEVRDLMLEEVEFDISNNNIYLSAYMSPNDSSVKEEYIKLLKEMIEKGSVGEFEQRVSPMLSSHSFNRGGRAKGPDSHIIFANGEFNRYYIRGVCKKVMASNGGIIIYRAKESDVHRYESDAKIGMEPDPSILLEDLRGHQGMSTELGIALPNSGLSVNVVE